MRQEFILGLVLINFIWLTLITVRQVKLLRKGKELFEVTDKGSLFDLVNTCLVRVRKVGEENEKTKTDLKSVLELFKNSFQKMGLVRYNPFKDVGGDLSFSVALLDYNNNGIIITNIASREGNRVYAKPVKKGASDHNLSEEEKEAIDKACKIREGRKEGHV